MNKNMKPWIRLIESFNLTRNGLLHQFKNPGDRKRVNTYDMYPNKLLGNNVLEYTNVMMAIAKSLKLKKHDHQRLHALSYSLNDSEDVW